MSAKQIARIILKSGRDKSAKIRHPWIFSGAIKSLIGQAESGEIVRVENDDGEFLAYGYYNGKSQITVRLLSWDENVGIDDEWWIRRIASSVSRRDDLRNSKVTNAIRLVHAEADGLPGLVVDQFDDVVVLQALTSGVERMKPLITDQLNSLLKPTTIFERTDPQARNLEGLMPSRGPLLGSNPPVELTIEEYGRQFLVDVLRGQKTGFYLDQRDNRHLVASHADGLDVLDCFAYTGGFTVHAMAAGARSLTCIESSAPSVELMRKNIALNGGSEDTATIVTDNVYDVLRVYRDKGRRFDMVILDPPKLAPTRAHVDKALRSYKDLNLLALKILNPNGILATFSCSSGVNPGRFQQVVAWAALDAGREVQVMRRLAQPSDHPVLLSFPESEYLNGLVCRVF